jgi:hypothetical protein
MCLFDVIESQEYSTVYASKLKLLCSRRLSALSILTSRGDAAFFSFRHSMPAPDSVVLETNLGNIQLELYWDHAPRVRLLSSLILNL